MLAHVATGQVHAYYEEHMNSWDALAGMLIIVRQAVSVMRFWPMTVC
jgi:fructose-1,6-bisphosphatase/inositol monophosphatase family enzyme